MDQTPAPRSRIPYLLRRAVQVVESEKGARLMPLGLHAAHYSLLVNVAETPGVTGADLARRLAVTPQNIASLVARLQARKLLERRPHPRHGHVLELFLTRSGKSLVARADKVVEGLESDLVDTLGARDSAHLQRIITRLLAQMPAIEQSTPR